MVSIILSIVFFVSVNLPYQNADLSAKAYMDYRTITCKSSEQYQLIHSDSITIREDGFLVDEYGFICVAMGSFFGDIGDRYILELEDGTFLKVIKADEKADCDTDSHNIRDYAGGIIELIIDTKADYMQNNIAENGYIFSGNFNNCEYFEGNIIGVYKISKEKREVNLIWMLRF